MNSGSIYYNSGVNLSILPFESLGVEKGHEIFCKSFYLDLVTELSRFRQFQIVSLGSVNDPGLSAIDPLSARTRGIDYLIRGSILNHGEKIRINAQLINCHTGHLSWTDRFDGKIDSLFTMQEDLLREIVSSLQKQLNFDLLNQVRKKSSVSLKAYESWLYGMEELKKGSFESDLKAREYFLQAIEIDPSYSLAYSGMSLTYFNEWSCQLWDRWEVSQSGAFEWAEKAIALDEQNYIASMVLGRIFLYEGAYETAEHYLRKSLRLNPNDPDSLIQIASCFTFLGYGKEAYQLYEKTLQLDPARPESIYSIGAFILFELGEFEEAIKLSAKTDSFPWVDSRAYFAAAYYHVGDYAKMNQYWQSFMETYTEVINRGKPATSVEAIRWMMKLNPFKEGTKLEPFWNHISQGEVVSIRPVSERTNYTVNQINEFLKDGVLWKISFDGLSVLVPEVKGYLDIQKLLTEPGKPFHCAELMQSAIREDGEPLLDSKAKKSYQRKILELQEEISNAENHYDFEKSRMLQEEYDQLIDHLSKSLGLQGKSRQSGNPVEKARSAVTWRIRNAVSKIEKVHPALGKHFSASIKTGTFCVYQPEKAINWSL